jgi:prolyl-tRNA synthetase
MKGVPIRIDLGLKDIKKKKITIFRRDLNKKEIVSEKNLIKKINQIAKEFTKNLIKEADKIFENRIKKAKNLNEIKKAVENGLIVKCNFCSIDKEGFGCADKIEKETNAQIRGTKLDEEEKPSGKCVICKRNSNEIVYIARAY